MQLESLSDGNPLETIVLVADPARNFLVIMKDGKIYQNTLRPCARPIPRRRRP